MFSKLNQLDRPATPIGYMADLNRCWEKILNYAVRVNYSKGTIIPHTEISGFYYLYKGTVSIFYLTSGGKERLTLCLEPGCIFNEARSMTGYDPEGSFVCTSDTELWRFPAKLLTDKKFIRENPDQIANLMYTMGLKMLIHYTFLAEMGVGSTDEHVCRFILNLSKKNGDKLSFPCKMNQQRVADLLGIHRATLARALQRLKRNGVIEEFTAKRVIISNMEALTHLAKHS